MIVCSIYLESWASYIDGTQNEIESIRGEILIEKDDKNIILTNIPIISTLSNFIIKIDKCIEQVGRDFIVSDHEIFTLELSNINCILSVLHTESQIELSYDIYNFKLCLMKESISFYEKYFANSKRQTEIRNCIYNFDQI